MYIQLADLLSSDFNNDVISITKLCKRLGISPTGDIVEDIIKKLTISNIPYKYPYGIRDRSLQFSPNDKESGTSYCKTSAIYAVICRSSKRRYIGASTRPDLRRAVHFYWLKNYKTYNHANVFWGNPILAKDIEQFGIEDFYIEIVESMPDVSHEEFLMKEQQIINSYPKHQLYNVGIEGRNKALAAISPEFVELLQKEKEVKYAYSEMQKHINEFKFAMKQEVNSKVRQELRIQLHRKEEEFAELRLTRKAARKAIVQWKNNMILETK